MLEETKRDEDGARGMQEEAKEDTSMYKRDRDNSKRRSWQGWGEIQRYTFLMYQFTMARCGEAGDVTARSG